jgi:small subunit ribosomal protein S20
LANTKSAIKRQRQNEKRRVRNRAVRSTARTMVAKARTAIEQSQPTSAEQVRVALSTLDITARKGVIHPNNAARRKSRLMKKLNAALAAGQV